MKINGKVRNFKKFNNGNNKGGIQGTQLESLGLGKYQFPICGEVPPGEYFSEIKEVRETVTAKGKPTIEVYYKIENAYTIYQIANGRLPDTTKVDTYYIKQSYVIGTPYYYNFLDGMAEALGRDKFREEDVVGVTEHVELSYGNSDIGGFSERTPFERDWYEVTEESQSEETTEETELSDPCENNIPNSYDEDDDNDDYNFFDEDDDFDDFSYLDDEDYY